MKVLVLVSAFGHEIHVNLESIQTCSFSLFTEKTMWGAVEPIHATLNSLEEIK